MEQKRVYVFVCVSHTEAVIQRQIRSVKRHLKFQSANTICTRVFVVFYYI